MVDSESPVKGAGEGEGEEDEDIDDYGMMQVVGSPLSLKAARKTASLKKSVDSERCDLVLPDLPQSKGVAVQSHDQDPNSH